MELKQYNSSGQPQLVNSNIRSYSQRGNWNGYNYNMTYNVTQSDISSEQILCVRAVSIQREIKIKHVKTQALKFYTSDTIYQSQTGYMANNPLPSRNASTTTSGDYYIYTVNLPANRYLYITYQSGSQSGGTSTYPWYVNTYSRANPTEVYMENPQPYWSDINLNSYATGVNEFDPNNLDTASATISSGSIAYNSSNECVRIPCKKNTTYKVGFSLPAAKSTVWRVFYTDSENYPTSGSPISGTTVVNDSSASVTSKSTTFKTSNTAKYIWLQVTSSVKQDIYPYIYVQKENGWYPSEDVHSFANNIWS